MIDAGFTNLPDGQTRDIYRVFYAELYACIAAGLSEADLNDEFKVKRHIVIMIDSLWLISFYNKL